MGTVFAVFELTMLLSVISGLALICVAGANIHGPATYGSRVVRRQPVVVVDDRRPGGHDRISSWDDDHFDGYGSRPVVDDWRHGHDGFSSWEDHHDRPSHGHDGFSSWDDHYDRPSHGHDGFSSWDDDHYDRPSHWEDRRVFRHRSRAPVRGAGRARFPVLHGVRHRSRSGY